MTMSELIGVWVARIVGWSIIALSAWVLMRFVRGDRARGRRRCPRCWYELGRQSDTGSPGEGGPPGDSSRRCSECGFVARSEAMLGRTRRRVRGLALAAVLALAGAGIVLAPRVYREGWASAVPGPVLYWMVPYAGQGAARSAVDELRSRHKSDLTMWINSESRYVQAFGNADGDNLGILATWLDVLGDEKSVTPEDRARALDRAAEAAMRTLSTVSVLGASNDVEQAAQVLGQTGAATVARAARLQDWLLGLSDDEFSVASGLVVSSLWSTTAEVPVFAVWAGRLDAMTEEQARRTLKMSAQVRADHGAMIEVLRRWEQQGADSAMWRRGLAEEFLPILTRRSGG
ncbi:MAG: hypothetical protein ACK5WB_06665 [Phycisphaerales bacterium]|nr:hypothetical protein [Phycisphaeraceae bacterium]